jgi:hypothetical protein
VKHDSVISLPVPGGLVLLLVVGVHKTNRQPPSGSRIPLRHLPQARVILKGDGVILLVRTVRARMRFQEDSDGPAQIGPNKENRHQNRSFRTVSFPFSTRVLPPSSRDKLRR